MDLGDEETTLMEAGELFEENWFFGNLLDRKTRMMSRCFSDPCPSSKHRSSVQEMFVGESYDQTYSSINKNLQQQNNNEEFSYPSLIKAPSMPTPVSRKVLSSSSSSSSPEVAAVKESDRFRGRICKSAACNNLPFSADKNGDGDGDEDEDEDEESDYSMGKLIRQASLGHSSSDMLLPRRTTTTPKVTIPTTVPRYRPRRKQEQESIKTDRSSSEERRRQHVLNRTKSGKGLADLKSEVVKGFEEFGHKFDKKEFNPNIVNMINPGLQEKKREVFRRPYAQRSTPQVLSNNNGGKKSAEDMKAQIKFWARAVASNVRQEC